MTIEFVNYKYCITCMLSINIEYLFIMNYYYYSIYLIMILTVTNMFLK